ncbi:MAG: DNA-3-methyladenine glycosylase, partial [Gemmatimonadales bacterium]
LAPVSGVEDMRAARAGGVARRALRELDLTSGPARLCQALGIAGDDDAADLVRGDRGLRIVDDGVLPPAAPGVSGRVGIRQGAELPWRFWVPGDANVSRPSGPAPAAGRR